MPDYGHPLQFSTFPEPAAQPAQAVVELAVLSEQWGYDLVTLQDHLEHPGYLDTWTLLTWIAARTERILIGPNVLNMAIRSPVITAKSAASLDLLTGGRVVLGLGAGSPPAAGVTLGLDRRSAREAVDALEESLAVIRASWPAPTTGTTNAGPVHVAGRYHRLNGLLAGPPAAHPIPLWLGGARPRMLRMVGRLADGWTSGLGADRSRAAWRESNALVDDAAREAGRDPADIRRIVAITGRFSRHNGFLTGPPQQWVDQLLPRVVEDGIGTIVLATNDEPTLQRFAEEVIPGLRGALAQERSRRPRWRDLVTPEHRC